MMDIGWESTYKDEVKEKYAEALKRLAICSCGKLPRVIYPIFTTQVCTVVTCDCGKRAFGEPEDPVSAVDNWNARCFDDTSGIPAVVII